MGLHNEYIVPEEDKDVPCVRDDSQEGKAVKRFSMGNTYASASTANPSRYSQSVRSPINHEKYRECLRKLEAEEEERQLEDAEEALSAATSRRKKKPRRQLFKVRPRRSSPPEIETGSGDEKSSASVSPTQTTFSSSASQQTPGSQSHPSATSNESLSLDVSVNSNIHEPSSTRSRSAGGDSVEMCPASLSDNKTTEEEPGDNMTTTLSPSSSGGATSPTPTFVSEATPSTASDGANVNDQAASRNRCRVLSEEV
ncbi:hypothetical protein IAR50_005568 [Cryptococcus sp. DSM 104548]